MCAIFCLLFSRHSQIVSSYETKAKELQELLSKAKSSFGEREALLCNQLQSTQKELELSKKSAESLEYDLKVMEILLVTFLENAKFSRNFSQ